MKYQGHVWRAVLLTIGGILGSLTILRLSSAAPMVTPQQEVIRLEGRITQLEQRLFSIETNVRNLEQQSRISGVGARSNNQDDLNQLRSEIQALQQRLIDDECGLAKLDERTLPRDVRDTRKRSVAGSDPCRLNVEMPLRLPGRH